MCIFSCFSLSGQETFRSWTDVQGRTVSAKYIKLSGSNVIIEREADRRKMTFPLGRLSQSDQSYVKKIQVQAATSLSRNDYKGMLLREKKWTNRVGDSFQRFFFAFKLDKVDNDKDGIPDKVEDTVKEVKRRANRVKEELKDVKDAAIDVVDQVGDVAGAVKGKPRKGRKPRAKKSSK